MVLSDMGVSAGGQHQATWGKTFCNCFDSIQCQPECRPATAGGAAVLRSGRRGCYDFEAGVVRLVLWRWCRCR
jgi:hypothetical protein